MAISPPIAVSAKWDFGTGSNNTNNYTLNASTKAILVSVHCSIASGTAPKLSSGTFDGEALTDIKTHNPTDQRTSANCAILNLPTTGSSVVLDLTLTGGADEGTKVYVWEFDAEIEFVAQDTDDGDKSAYQVTMSGDATDGIGIMLITTDDSVAGDSFDGGETKQYDDNEFQHGSWGGSEDGVSSHTMDWSNDTTRRTAVLGTSWKATSAKPTTPNAPTETTGASGEQPTSVNDLLAGPDQGSYQWTASASGTNEYYLEASGGGDPGLTFAAPDHAFYLDGALMTEGSLGSLADHEYGVGDNDTLGFTTLYVRDDSGDPDTSGAEIIQSRATEYLEVTGIDNTLGNDIRIEGRIVATGSWETLVAATAITGTTMTFTVTDLPADRGVEYRAVVINTDEDPDVESDPSASSGGIRSAPEPPTQVDAAQSGDHIVISWFDNTGDAYAHEVIETTADPDRTVGTAPAGDDSLTDLDPGAGSYTYEVRSYNATDDKRSGPVTASETIAAASFAFAARSRRTAILRM